MDSDYYQVLGLARCATQEEVQKAFRRLALKNQKTTLFEAICEAFWVLGDVEKRALYDHQGSLDAVYNSQGEKSGGWTYSHSREKVFETFFRTRNPFAEEKWSPTPPPRESPPVSKRLECTLEELYNGCTKTFETTRKRQVNTEEYVDRTTELTVRVLPGWKAGTKITFAAQGDEGPGVLAADIIFELVQVKHEFYRRNGDDLECTARVTLAEALSGTIVRVRTLDGRSLSISCPEVVSPGYKKIVPNEGMPISSTTKRRRGNLVVDFEITFPKFIAEPQKLKLKKILNEEIQ